MKSFKIITLLLLLIVSASAQVIPTFTSMDRDNSKDIDKKEAKKFYIVRSNFERADKDSDGYIDEEEYDVFRDKIMAQAKAERDRRLEQKRKANRRNSNKRF